MSATIGTGERGTICASAIGRFFLVARAAHDVAARGGERVDLRERAVDVGGLGGGHRLHRDRRVAADRDRADHDLPGVPPFAHAAQATSRPEPAGLVHDISMVGFASARAAPLRLDASARGSAPRQNGLPTGWVMSRNRLDKKMNSEHDEHRAP